MATIHLTGRIGADAQPRQFAQKQYTCFRLADTRRYTDGNGQQQEQTTWYTCMKRDDSGKLCPWLTKGTKVYVHGSFSVEQYQAKDGTTRQDNRVMVADLEFMSGKPQQQTDTPEQAQPQQYQQQQYTQPQRPPQNVNNLWDYATGGRQMNVQQRAPQTPPQEEGDDLPF